MPSHCRARDGGLGHLQPEFSELAGRPPSESFLSFSGQSPGELIPCWVSFHHIVTDHLYHARHHAALCLCTGILGYVPRAQLGSANITGDNTTTLFLSQNPGRNLVGLGAEKQAVVGRFSVPSGPCLVLSGCSLEISPPSPCPVILPHVALGSQNPRQGFLGPTHIQFCIIRASSAQLADAAHG